MTFELNASSDFDHLHLHLIDWITPDTIADIQKQNPKLIKALENPKFVQALTDIQTNPQGAFEVCQKRCVIYF